MSKANDLLGASYQLYRHTETNETIVRTVGYSLPVALHAHVQTVAPTTYFASPHMLWQTTRKRTGGIGAGLVKAASDEALSVRADVIPADAPFLHWLYKTEAYIPAATAKNLFAIAGYAGEYPSPTDLRMFMHEFHGPGTGATYEVTPVNSGEYKPENPGLEANVDVQYAEVMTYPTKIMYYSTGNGPLGKNDPYLSWLAFMLDIEPEVPQTISTSYAEYEKNFPLDYAKAVCDLFAELSARGVSVLFAAGDKGVGQGDCTINGNARFLPTSPATCTYDGFLCVKAVHKYE